MYKSTFSVLLPPLKCLPPDLWEFCARVHGALVMGAHQLCTSCTEGVLSTRSGSKLISFMMLARRTGSSCRRKVKEVFSHALLEPMGQSSGHLSSLVAPQFGLPPPCT